MSVPDLTIEQGMELVKAAFIDELQEILRYRTEMTKQASLADRLFGSVGKAFGRGAARSAVTAGGARAVATHFDDLAQLEARRAPLTEELQRLQSIKKPTAAQRTRLSDLQNEIGQLESQATQLGTHTPAIQHQMEQLAPGISGELATAGQASAPGFYNPLGRLGRGIHRAVSGSPKSMEEFVMQKAQAAGVDPSLFLAQTRADPTKWGALQAEWSNINRSRGGLGALAAGGGIYGGGKLLGDQVASEEEGAPGGWGSLALGGLGMYGGYNLLEQAGLPEWAQLLGGAAAGIYTPKLLG